MNTEKIKKWQKILEGQKNEIREILERRFIFQEIKKIVESNPSINQENIFYDYFRINYIYAQIIQISRILDQDPRAESFYNLLTDIEENPEIFKQEWRNKLYVLPDGKQDLFPRKFTEENMLNADVVSKNKCLLLCKFEPIKKYRDKQVAHKQKKGAKPNLSFKQLDDFIDIVHECVKTYYHFLFIESYADLLPEIGYDWQNIFRKSWIKQF